MNFNQIIQLFQAEILSKGITPPKDLIADAQLHRFHIVGDKLSSKNGWYLLHLDGIPCGMFGSWKRDGYSKWSAKNRESMSSYERTQQIERIKETSRIRCELKIKEQYEAAQLAEQLWHSYSKVDPNHLYLTKKHISPFYARQHGKELVLPVINYSGEICSLQYITECGSKRFLSNGAIKGHFIPVQGRPGDGKRILICEGFATGATLAKNHFDSCVIAACDAGNLKPVAMKIRQKLSDAEIVICADDDRLNPDNPGINKGRAAAIASSSSFSRPKWPKNAPDSLKDYNDLACWIAEIEVPHV